MIKQEEHPLKKVCIICAKAAIEDVYATLVMANGAVMEGIEAKVPYKGRLAEIVFQLIGGLRAGMGYTGSKTIEALKTKTKIVKVSGSGLRESHPHDVIITKDAPNYSR